MKWSCKNGKHSFVNYVGDETNGRYLICYNCKKKIPDINYVSVDLAESLSIGKSYKKGKSKLWQEYKNRNKKNK